MRRVASTNEFFDLLDGIKGGAIVSLGYVAGSNLNVPMVKRKNPATNRMKSFPDYSGFEGGDQIGALVMITSYHFNYRKRQSVHDYYYNVFKPGVNKLNQEFGIPEMGSKQSYKAVANFGQQGQELYDGNNEALFGNSYSPQNMFKPLHRNSSYYAVGTDGHIIRELSKAEMKTYAPLKKDLSGVKALRNMGAADEVIKDYVNRYNELKFSYKNFESKSILYIVATVNGEKLIYINDNLMRTVDDININPQDFIAIAKEKYQEDLAESKRMYKKMIAENRSRKTVARLTESDLHRIVKESVEQVLSEGWHNPFINEISSRLLRRASDKAFDDMKINWNNSKIRTKREAQWKKFSRGAYDKEKKEKESICQSVPESELKNMPKDTYVILDGEGRDFYGEFMYGYSGYAGTKEQCTAFVNRYYDKSANWEFLPIIVKLEDYFQHYT